MRTSETIKELATALPSLQSEIKKVVKDTDGFNYKYANLEQIVEMIRPLLGKHKFSLVHLANDHQAEHYIETILLHESGEWLSGSMKLELTKADMQGLGSAQTYARRYGTLGMLLIAPEDDDGQSIAVASEKQIKMLYAVAKKRDLVKDWNGFIDLVRKQTGGEYHELRADSVDEFKNFLETGEIK